LVRKKKGGGPARSARVMLRPARRQLGQVVRGWTLRLR
jgi:hypothetical protein